MPVSVRETIELFSSVWSRYRFIRYGSILLTVISVFLIGFSIVTRKPIPPYLNGKILYTDYYNRTPQLYLINGDGSGLTLLTEHGENFSPALSPDAKTAAFIHRIFPHDYSIYLMNPDGSNQTKLVDLPPSDMIPGNLVWSPDGHYLAFTRYRDVPYQQDVSAVWLVDTAGSHFTSSTEFQGRLSKPSWAPDSSNVIFAAYGKIYTFTPAGVLRLLLNSTVNGENNVPAWSPDGKYIAYSHHSSFTGKDHVYLMQADRTHSRRLTNSQDDHIFLKVDVAWSPDQKRLLVAGYCRDCELVPAAYDENTLKYPARLFVIDVETSQVVPLNPEGGYQGIWLAGSQHIIFTAHLPTQYGSDFHVINADGSEKLRISNDGDAGYDPIWIPAQ
jgi:hypothetical protein